jgi:hypothetical protein
MFRNSTWALILVAAVGFGCPDDDDDDGGGMDARVDTGVDTGVQDSGADAGVDTGVEDTGVDAGSDFPARPELGTQLDRSGRPAIATALISPIGDDPEQGMRKDDYNAATILEWPEFAPDIQANLGLYDGLDGVCANQFLAGVGTATDSPNRYQALAGALTDDRLWISATSTTCTQYLGVELDALGVLPNDDCGGRTLTYDVIDLTYSALSIGAPAGVTDGIDGDNVTQSNTDFPFLAAP